MRSIAGGSTLALLATILVTGCGSSKPEIDRGKIFELGETVVIGWTYEDTPPASFSIKIVETATAKEPVAPLEVIPSVSGSTNDHWEVEAFSYDSTIPAGEYKVIVEARESSGTSASSTFIYLTPWDWTRKRSAEIFFTSGDSPPNRVLWDLPYHSPNGYVGSVMKVDDIDPRNGWVLLSKEFGSVDSWQSYPRFILYNRFSGTLRVFYLYLSNAKYTSSLATLKGVGSDLSLMLSFGRVGGVVEGERIEAATLSYIGPLESNGWNYADFSVPGYQPNIEEGAEFEFQMWGVDTSEISLEGELSSIDTADKSSDRRVQSSGSVVDTAGDAIQLAGDVWTAYTGTKDAVASLRESFEPGKGKLGNEFYSKDLYEALSSAAADWVPYVGALAPIVELAFPSLGAGPAQVKFDATLELSGSIESKDLAQTFRFPVPGSTQKTDSPASLYPYPLGLYALANRPQVRVETIRGDGLGYACLSLAGGPSRQRKSSDWGPDTAVKTHRQTLASIQTIRNPYLGRDLELEVAYAPEAGGNLVDFASLSPSGSMTSETDGFYSVDELKSKTLDVHFAEYDMKESRDCLEREFDPNEKQGLEGHRRFIAVKARIVGGSGSDGPTIHTKIFEPDFVKT